jgi:hypothetical protein
MTTIALGDFAPAASSFNRGAIDTVRGMQPVRDGWGKFNQFVHQSAALGGAVLGGIEAIDPADGTTHIYAATASGMYRLNTATSPWSWTDVSNSALGSYTLSDEDPVSFTVFGDKVIAANAGFPGLQVATIGSGTFSTISGAPTARYVVTFADRVWALGQVATPNRVEYSAPRNHTVWGDVNRGADFQVFESGGEVTGGAVVGDLLYVFQTDAIQGFARQGMMITRRELRQKFGAPSGQSIVEAPAGAFFLSEDGFYLAGAGGAIQSVGAQIVDSWFMGGSEVDLTKLWSVQGAHDPANKLVIWRYARPGFAGVGYSDRAIGFNYDLQKWFPLALESGHLMRASAPSQFSDGISDLSDEINLSIDSRVYDGGRPQLAGFDNQFRFGFFSGGAMEAEIETANIQFAQGRRAFVSGFRPIVEGTNAYTGAIGTKATPTDATTFNALTSPNRGGMITQRGDGLSHKFKINIPAGEAWSALTAIEVDGIRPSGWA